MYVTAEATGGMAHYTCNLAMAMQSLAECRVGIMTAPDQPLVAWDGVPITKLPMSGNRLRHRLLEKYNPSYYRDVGGQIARESPELVHVTAAPPGLLWLTSTLVERSIKTVYTLHDPLPHDEVTTAWGHFHRWYQTLYETPAALATIDAIHVHSAQHAVLLTERYGRIVSDKVYVVHHGAGVTPAIGRGVARPPELDRLQTGWRTVLFFGRIQPYKGLDLLLEAVRQRDAAGLSINVVIAGAGPVDQASLALPHSRTIVINRFIHDDEIRALFAASDIVVLPYRTATQSGVVPLAYALSRPVIATRVGALADVVIDGTTGFLVQPNDVTALARAMQRLVSDSPLRARMGRQAFDLATGKLSWSAAAKLHFEHYSALLASA